MSEATGRRTLDWSLTNVGRPCVLDGYPEITALDGQGRVVGFTYSRSGDAMTTSAAPHAVYLPTASSAWIRLDKYRCDVAAAAATSSLRLNLPSTGGALELAGLSFDVCAQAPSLTVVVSPFEPVEMLLHP